METGRGDKNDGGCLLNVRKLGNSPRRFLNPESCLNYPYYPNINSYYTLQYVGNVQNEIVKAFALIFLLKPTKSNIFFR